MRRLRVVQAMKKKDYPRLAGEGAYTQQFFPCSGLRGAGSDNLRVCVRKFIDEEARTKLKKADTSVCTILARHPLYPGWYCKSCVVSL